HVGLRVLVRCLLQASAPTELHPLPLHDALPICFVTVTDVRVTGDLQHATIFYTVLGQEEDREATAAALASAKGLIRSEVGKRTGVRLTPTLEFIPDALPETAAHLEDALRRAAQEDAELAARRDGAAYAGDANPYRDEVAANDQQDTESKTPGDGDDARR